jgi:hypothetical protein
MPRGKAGVHTPKTQSFRFTAADVQRLEEAQRLMGLESRADVIRALLARYLEEHHHHRQLREHVHEAVEAHLERRLPGLVEQQLRDLGPELVARVLAQVVADGVRRGR